MWPSIFNFKKIRKLLRDLLVVSPAKRSEEESAKKLAARAIVSRRYAGELS